jgi:DNA-binding transcriptional LysR family regulator
MIDPDIEIFARVVDAGSLAAAARDLHISAPMVSRRLARLEARLGVTLADRTTRRLTLTTQGERFYRDVAALLESWRQAEARVMNATRIAAGPLRISAPTSFGRLYLAPFLNPFADRYPDVHITLDLSDGFVDLVEQRFDLAIRITGDAPAGDQAERLAGSARLLCAAPAYLADHGEPLSLADLAEHRLLAADGQLPWRLVADGAPVVINGRSHIATNSSEVVRELAIAGMGIALRSLWDVHSDLMGGRLRPVLPSVTGSSEVGIYAILPKGHVASAAAKAFIAHLRALLQPVAPWERPGTPP